ncbi:MAG: hypothetical protein AB7V26_12255 [Lysobacterales bacterium]
MIKVIFILASLAVLTTARAGVDAPLRVVLNSGWVIPLSGDGSKLTGTPVKLALPDKADGIYSATADYAYNRLYVVPQTPYNARGAVVYELSSLRRIAFLPGVSEVLIPADPDVDMMVTRVYEKEGGSSFGSSARIEELIYETHDSTRIQSRMRKNARTILHQHVDSGDNQSDYFGVFQCFSRTRLAYLSRPPFVVVSQKLDQVILPEGKTLESRGKALQDGVIIDCWPNGDVLKYYDWDTEQRIFVNHVPAEGGAANIIGDIRMWEGFDEDGRGMDGRAYALGANGRYAMIYNYHGGALVFDFKEHDKIPLEVYPSAAGRYVRQVGWSRNRDKAFFVEIYYQYRSAIDHTYIESGSNRVLQNRLYVLSVEGAPTFRPVPLPAELEEINEYLRRKQEIMSDLTDWKVQVIQDDDSLTDAEKAERVAAVYRERLTDEQKTEQIAKLPPLSALGQQVGKIEIVGALQE